MLYAQNGYLMSGKLLLIDGHSILNRAFYGVPRLTNSQGLPTNAVYGFLNILFSVIDKVQPDHCAVAFDLKQPTFRHKMYDAYKGTRHPMPDDLHVQVPVMRNVLESMGIKTVSAPGFEADDCLGTLAKLGEAAGMEVVILSGDRDLLQLVTEKTTMRLPRTSKGVTTVEDFTPEKVLEEFGVRPDQIVDLKAMMGDSSDNIPGLPGVGEKTAVGLIQLYGTLENAHEHASEIKAKKAREAFTEHYELGLMSQTLATIVTDAPLDTALEELKIDNFYTPEAYELFRELEFKKLLGRFTEENKTEAKCPDVLVINDIKKAEDIIARAEKTAGSGFCLDIADKDGKAMASGAAFSYGELIAYIPADLLGGEHELLETVKAYVEKAKRPATIGFKDQQKLLLADEKKDLMDAEIADYLLNPLKKDYPHEQIAAEFTSIQLPSAEEIAGGKITAKTVITPEQSAKITGYKAYSAQISADAINSALEEKGMKELYYKTELPLIYTLSDMESEGIMLLKDELASYSESLSGSIAALEASVYEAAGEEFNVNSPKQLGVILFEKLGLPHAKKTKSGYSTAADVLEKLAEDHHVVSDILNYRQLTKLKSTYGDALGTYCDPESRIHTHFQQTVTATGRLSSTEPNLQNIPVRIELGRQIRKVFAPKEGCAFIDADYSQIELRVMAHLSGDEKLIAAYNSSDDIHALTASQVFNVPITMVTPEMRRNAKAVNFGIIYGISSFGLSEGLSISRKEAQDYIEQYFRTYPGIKAYLDKTVAAAKEQGYTTTMFGRIRPIPELSNSNYMQRQFGERVAMNSPIQGTAADIIKFAMNNVRKKLAKEGLKTKLILQVHDELLLEAPLDEVEAASKILRNEMMKAAKLSVPLEVDLKVGRNWYEAH